MFDLRIALVLLLIAATCEAAKDKCEKGTTKACSKLGGTCVSKKPKCKGTSFTGKKYCSDFRNCVCCVEKEPTTPEPTTPEPTTPKPTTPEPTTPEPTTPVPTTPFWTTGPNGTSPPGPGPQGEGCYNPIDETNVVIRTEVTGPCDTYICTDYGWVYLTKASDKCCSLTLNDNQVVSYLDGTVTSIDGPNGMPIWMECVGGTWTPASHNNCNKDCGHWCYPSTKWPSTCSDFCDGTKQSPIDIPETATPETDQLTFSDTYNLPIENLTIMNNGHTVGATWNISEPARTISDGGLNGNYTLATFHFHWGCENDRGSEHTVNGKSYAMELHLVHYKTSYGSLSNALNFEDGLAVLGIFFNISQSDNLDLQGIFKGLPDVVAAGSAKEIDLPLPLMNLIPVPTFYRYQGGLTTPTCNEVVIWSVFTTNLMISEKQVKALRMLKDKESHNMCDNYRDTQPLNGRMVKMYN